MSSDIKKINKIVEIEKDIKNFVFEESENNEKDHEQFSRDIEILDNKIENIQLIPGEKGEKGDKGDSGNKGEPGKPGKDGVDGKDGKDGKDGLDGKDGYTPVKGKDYFDGEKGEKGDKPKHRWKGSKLQFEKPDGSWGQLIDLKGLDGQNLLPNGSLGASYPSIKLNNELLTTGAREINFLGSVSASVSGTKVNINIQDDQPGSEVVLDTTNFNGILSATEDTAQKAFDKLDDVVASDIDITDTGDYYTGTEVETALQELGAKISNWDTAYTHSQITDGTNPHSVNHNNLGNLAWSVAGHTIDTNIVMGDNSITGIDTLAFTDVNGTIAGIENQNLLDKTAVETISGAYTHSALLSMSGADIDLAGNDLLNVGTLNINATTDHTITNSSDVLVITNPNSQRGIYFNTGNGTVSGNHFYFNEGGNGSFAIKPSSSYTPTGTFVGIIDVSGTWSLNSVFSAMKFAPITPGTGQFIAFFVIPTLSNGAIGLRYSPLFNAAITNGASHTGIEMQFPTAVNGKTDTIYSYKEDGNNRSVFTSTGAITRTMYGYKAGGSTSALALGFNATITDYHIHLTGGVSEASITGTANAKQYGIYMTGFGGAQPTNGEMYALLTNGGLYSHKYDYNGTTNAILMGAGEDWGFGFTGSIMKLEALVGTADFHIDCGTEKTLVLDETVWNDVQFNIETGRVGAANFPDWDTAFTTNTGAYKFAVDDYIDLGTNEIPHGWKEGTALKPHLHLTLDGANASGSNQYVKFTVYIAYSDVNEIWTETSLTAEYTIPTGTADMTHLLLSLGDLVFTNQLIGTQMNIRIKRIAATSGTEYPNHIFVTQFGIHYETDTIGSRTVAAK